jgi:hypothetical protein
MKMSCGRTRSGSLDPRLTHQLVQVVIEIEIEVSGARPQLESGADVVIGIMPEAETE